METERIKELDEEIQVLTAQVNAYSRECEKQKGLVALNQERHKTEVRCTCTVQYKILMAANFVKIIFVTYTVLSAAIVILH